jgi:hypothetical protein
VRLSNDRRIVVRGLNVQAVAAIVARFPGIVGLLLGGVTASEIGPKFVLQLGDATGAIIAAGCGQLGNQDEERHANAGFNLEDQTKLIVAVVRATCPNGFGFFLEMMATLNSASEGAKPARIRLRKSQLPSQPSSDAASLPTMQ